MKFWESAPGEDGTWKLLDVNLIIVGTGPAAELLLQRRLDAGGRACLLWTQLSHQPAPKGAVYEHDLASFDEETFIWQPPALDQACREVSQLRHRFGSWDYGFMRSGPDIVALPDGGRYELLLDGQNRVAGIRVLQGDVLCWQLSGAVLFVDASGADEEAAYVQQVNVSVQQEEAKPVIFTPFGGPAYLAGILAYLFFGSMNFGLLYTGERSAQAEDFDGWWWANRTLTVGGHVWTQLLVDTLLGRRQPLHAATVATLFGAVVWTLVEFFFILLFRGSRPQFFVFEASAFEISSLAQLACGFVIARGCRTSHPSSGATQTQDTGRHLVWTAFMFSMNVILLFAQYSIILGFMFLEGSSNILAGTFLSLSTTASELAAVSLMERAYMKLVWPRAGDQKRIVYGDQHPPVLMMINWAHSLCEGTRLVSLISVAARSPEWRWDWLGSVLVLFVNNLFVRHGYQLTLWTTVLPQKLQKSVCLGCYGMIHRHARVSCGYHRFVLFASYVIFRLSWLGSPASEALFNNHTLILFFVVVAAEVLEDAVVLLRLLPLDPWRESMTHLYEPLHPLHPKQVMCKDRRGIHARQVPLRLHGVRPQRLSETLTVMQLGASICGISLTLYVGMGYYLGVCPEPIPLTIRLEEALWWSQPLTCS